MIIKVPVFAGEIDDEALVGYADINPALKTIVVVLFDLPESGSFLATFQEEGFSGITIKSDYQKPDPLKQ